MRNFIRVTQHGYRRSEEASTYQGRSCLVRAEFFFDNEDREQVERALAEARAFRDSLPYPAIGSHMRCPARLCAYFPVPGHSEIALMGVIPARRGEGHTAADDVLAPICHHTRAFVMSHAAE